jgi:hypothetical protein
VLGGGHQLLGWAALDDGTVPHHDHLVGDAADDAEVVGDEQVADAGIGADVGEQVEYLGLHRDVEGGHRLIEHQQRGLDRERPGDGDPLALAAGQLPGPGISGPLAKANQIQQFGSPGPVVDSGKVQPEGLAQGGADGEPGVEGQERVLEHHLDLPRPGQPGGAPPRLRAPIGPVHQHRTRVGPLQPGHDPRRGCLARAGLADDP